MQTLSVLSDEHRRHYLGLVFGLLATFSLTAICYWPSLDGPFLFDDIPNLEPIGERGGLIAAEQYLEFIATPRSGPLGRPLSLASFTLNAKTWPADPRPFRITNLVIHLVNGFLIFLFARRVFSISQHRLTAEKLALMCAAMIDRTELLEVLLDHGADIEAGDEVRPAAHWARHVYLRMEIATRHNGGSNVRPSETAALPPPAPSGTAESRPVVTPDGR